jgi:hypothetical protein
MGIEARREEGVDRSLRTATEAHNADEIVAVEPADLGCGTARIALEIGAADKARQVGKAHVTARNEDKPALAEIGALMLPAGLDVAEVHGELAAEERLDPLTRRLLGKFERAEEVVGIGDAERRLLVCLCEIEERAELQRALEQRIGRMYVMVDEAGTGHRHYLGWQTGAANRGGRQSTAVTRVGRRYPPR